MKVHDGLFGGGPPPRRRLAAKHVAGVFGHVYRRVRLMGKCSGTANHACRMLVTREKGVVEPRTARPYARCSVGRSMIRSVYAVCAHWLESIHRLSLAKLHPYRAS